MARFDDEPWDEHHSGRAAVHSFYEGLLRAVPDLEIDVTREHANGETGSAWTSRLQADRRTGMSVAERETGPKEGTVLKKPRTIDDYLARVSPDKRAALEKVRAAVRSAAPEAEECISYGVPAFRLSGKFLVAFGVGANHCAFYPGGTAMEGCRAELARYDTSNGTIRFQAQAGLPVRLVRKLVKARMDALLR